jgi:hypothetical protein
MQGAVPRYEPGTYRAEGRHAIYRLCRRLCPLVFTRGSRRDVVYLG